MILRNIYSVEVGWNRFTALHNIVLSIEVDRPTLVAAVAGNKRGKLSTGQTVLTDVMTSLSMDAARSGCRLLLTRSASVLWSVMRWPALRAADLCGLIRDICGRGFSSLQQLVRTYSNFQHRPGSVSHIPQQLSNLASMPVVHRSARLLIMRTHVRVNF